MNKTTKAPDYLFEVGWEVCNKIGGIHTVISTKANSILQEIPKKYITIGPDVWKETNDSPEFIEDKTIFSDWVKQIKSKTEIQLRTGYWNIPGKPIVFLVDFKPYIQQKDQILAELWEQFNVDSITGDWDYIEPILFGYAAAKAIESFYAHYVNKKDTIVAHFHEWMTGSGILYLKQVPQIGTIFTTHATVLGRTISGNHLDLYKDIQHFNSSEIASRFNVIAKDSIEQAASRETDCFTTVSEITAQECKYLLHKPVDVVTPNGFEKMFVPSKSDFENKRNIARKKLIGLSQSMLNQKVDDDTIFLINSGRYEFRNKGIDIFIRALGALNRSNSLIKQVVAVIAVPADRANPNNWILDNFENPDFNNPTSGNYLTHQLNNPQYDPTLNLIQQNGLNNSIEDKVKIIFAPIYLNGEDGIINLDYYDFLIGFDLSVFPSYYEPWGYTPMESIAFSIPTITTTYAGFGIWTKEIGKSIEDTVIVIERDDYNIENTVNELKDHMLEFSKKTKAEIKKIRTKAEKFSDNALWKNQIDHYFKSYQIAQNKAKGRK